MSRAWGASVAVALGLGCGTGPGDAAHYRTALATAPDFPRAWSACGEIRDPGHRGDCQASVTERFDRRSAADCDQIDHAVWADECRFLLAERLGAAGDLDGALTACVASRFRRHCTWHLLEDAVEASIDRPDAAAEAELERFYQRKALADAAFQFWRIRHRLKNARGEALDERDCGGLRFPSDCTRALHMHVQVMLDELARGGTARVCGLPDGRRIMLATGPALVDGPLVAHAEADWVGRRCGGGAPALRPAGAPGESPD